MIDQSRSRGGDKSIEAEGPCAATRYHHKRYFGAQRHLVKDASRVRRENFLPNGIPRHGCSATWKMGYRRFKTHRDPACPWHQNSVRQAWLDILLVNDRSGAAKSGGDDGWHGSEATRRKRDVWLKTAHQRV
jgi:hypothetical protein